MQLLLHFLTSLTATSNNNLKIDVTNNATSNCPSNITLSGVSQDFGPWRPEASQKCNWSLLINQYGVGAIITFTIANIGEEDSVKIGPVLLPNKTYVRQSVTVLRNTTIEVITGANTQLVMEFSAAPYSIPRSEHIIDEYIFTSDRQSFVFYLSQWIPNQYHVITAKENDLIVIQRSEDLNLKDIDSKTDLLQWSNVLIIQDNEHYVVSMLDLLESGKFVSPGRNVVLFLTQPVTLSGAVLVNTGNNMAAFSSYGSLFTAWRHNDVTISFGQTGGRSCFTVIGPPGGYSMIIYSADPKALITVAEGGPDKDQKITVPLNRKLPLRMIGNIWTFYIAHGSGTVRFS